MAAKKTYIYGLFDPRTAQCFYVGKANDPQQRFRAHLKCRKNPAKHRRIRDIHRDGFEPYLQILESVPAKQWEAAEVKWIYQFTQSGEPLTNLTPGGMVPYAISVEDAHALLQTMPQKIDEFEAVLDRELTRPVPAVIAQFRLASFDAIKILTRKLITDLDWAVRLKTAMNMFRLMSRLEAKWQRTAA